MASNGSTQSFLFRSDNLLDNRPALISRGPGDLVVIKSSDSRREAQLLLKKGWDLKQLMGYGGPDPFNNDLYANIIALPPAQSPIAGRDLGPPPAATVIATAESERSNDKTVRDYRVQAGRDNLQIVRGEFHRHSEISMDGGTDGSILDQWRYILDPADLDWVGCCDHDNGGSREYSWWITQQLTDIFYTPGKFAPLFSYERSLSYPEGHRNVIFAQRGVRTLPRLQPLSEENATGHAPDTQNFYGYLKKYNGITASHTSGTDMGTDWRDNDPDVEPIVEIYQGMRQNYEIPDGPRSNTAKDSIGGWRPKGFVSDALQKGYKLGFQASSDHISTHQSYANVLVTSDTRSANGGDPQTSHLRFYRQHRGRRAQRLSPHGRCLHHRYASGFFREANRHFTVYEGRDREGQPIRLYGDARHQAGRVPLARLRAGARQTQLLLRAR